jgi:hypothetical protein
MPTLTIGDKRVTVGEEFMQLSPDQQHATVDEIAQQLGVGATAPAPIDPRERAAQVSALPVDQREQPSEAAMRSPLRQRLPRRRRLRLNAPPNRKLFIGRLKPRASNSGQGRSAD